MFLDGSCLMGPTFYKWPLWKLLILKLYLHYIPGAEDRGYQVDLKKIDYTLEYTAKRIVPKCL